MTPHGSRSLPSRDLILAVDCSTTASKAVLFDATGTAHSVGRHPVPLDRPGPGRHEQRAQDWWTATSSAIRQALASVDAARVGAVVVTHQRETFCCLDGNVELRPAIVWMDSRAQRLVRALGSDQVHAVSGRPPDNTPSLYKIAWLAENEPDVLQRATRVGDVGAYLNLRLTGCWSSSSASADCTGLMDMRTRTWAAQLCALAGVRVAQLPLLVHPGGTIGLLEARAAAELGLPSDVPVIAGAGDGQCAAVGAGAVGPGTLYLNMGTAIVCGAVTPDYSWSRNYRTVAAADDHGFLLEAFLSSGTYLVNWFVEQFGPFDGAGPDVTPEQFMEAAARALPVGADGLLALPYWNAAQTPYWDAAARGAVIGWTGFHSRTHLYRAILEGIAFEIRLQTESLSEAVDPAPHRVVVTGGGSRSDLWLQVLADVLDRPLEICAEPETTALGAAVLASIALGWHPDLSAAVTAMCRSAGRVYPQPVDVELYGRLWEIYRTLYGSLRPALAALSEFCAQPDHLVQLAPTSQAGAP